MKKFLLIQIRNNKIIADHEYKLFKSALKGVSLDKINIQKQDFNVAKLIKNYDAILVGGSNYSIRDKFPHREKFFQLIKKISVSKKPFLGVCFGFQALIEANGGKVIYDKKKEEFGSKIIYLNKKGTQDSIFRSLPKKFFVQQGHEWRVANLPKNMVRLARGNNVLNQAVKIKDEPVYGIQFHPELDKKEMLWRLNSYKKDKVSWYSFESYPFHRLIATPQSKKIFKNFIKIL